MKIKQLLEEHIQAGAAIKIEGDGARFTDRDEFIPFDDLGYSSELGFFRISDFPFMENEAA